jgi:MHS family proline/betaine transporter-like MFS transporter
VQSPVRTALAGLIGNVLEWFDFAVYGYFKDEIGKAFFPAESQTAQDLATYAVFALGFLARPVGSIVLGHVGDRIGRRALLTLSIALMGISTLVIGFLPTHSQIGVTASVLFVLMRVLQGFSLGGEFTGSMVYTTELASPLMRGLVSSSTAAGTTLGFILGSGTGYLVHANMSPAAVLEWGWRIPYIASITFCIAGYFLRHNIVEPEQGLVAKGHKVHFLRALRTDWKAVIECFGIVAMTNAAYYLVFTYGANAHEKAANADDFRLVNTGMLFVVLFAKPLGGWLSDRVGRRRLMIILTFVMLAFSYLALQFMLSGSMSEFALGQLLMGVPIGMALGLQGAMLVEIFPVTSRVTSMSIAYSVTLGLAGGSAPYVSTWLTSLTGNQLVPAFYIMVYGVIGLAIMWRMSETNQRALA